VKVRDAEYAAARADEVAEAAAHCAPSMLRG
jgi:hypothetical protein